jgi:tRNA threonylcarbamoyladenosine biosynthesis protein TsaE
MIKEYYSRSAEETRECARQFACSLKRGDVVALIGGLGAGKTEFVRGIADVFNCPELVTSPTFTIVNIYHGTLQSKPYLINHLDLYRLKSESELGSIGFDEIIYGEGISIIEWADRYPNAIPKQAHHVELYEAGNSQRRIVLRN